MKYGNRSAFFLWLIVTLLSFTCFTAEVPESIDTEAVEAEIQVYRQTLSEESDPIKRAEVEFKLAECLEKLGREQEATAKYLNLTLNENSGKYSNLAQEKLSNLLNKYSGKPVKPQGDRGAEYIVFFETYIRSYYEQLMNEGRYEEAEKFLKKLIKMDIPKEAYYQPKETYYEDLGRVYLEGYGDGENSLTYFKKILEINPNNPMAYIYMGLAYEKMNDINNAMKSYSKAQEIAPFNNWSIYGQSRMEAIKLAMEKKLVKDWYFIGPFSNKDRNALNTEFGPEKEMDLTKTYEGIEDNAVKWARPYTYDDSGYVDLNSIFKINDLAACYALTYAYSGEDRPAQFRLGSDDPILVKLNGKVIFKEEYVSRPAQLDFNVVNVQLKKGWNEILIKTSESFGTWGFYFRVTDEDGKAAKDIILDPLKNEPRAKKMYSGFRKAKSLKIARVMVLFIVSLVFFLTGIYLAISNIYHKIKIRQMKDDFIASVSHELKTPLAAIKMFAETLNMGRVKKEEDKKEYYHTIIRETDRLTRFINKILDFQKIEKGKKIYSFEKVDTRELLSNAIDIYKNQVQDDELKIEQECETDLPQVELDEDAMLQVFLNLLTNAYKYSKNEKYIKASIKKNDKGVLISIADHGMGIPKSMITKIFDKFYRVERDATKDIKGSGIGLAFSKSVVEAHGGGIGVESELDKGSTFTIYLPIERGT